MKAYYKVYIMRHGLDDENYIGGWSNVELVDEGIKQVELSAEFLDRNNYYINKIYHSGLKRSVETANIINKKLNLKIFESKELREINKGELNGLLVTDAIKKYPLYFETIEFNKSYPNGESYQDLHNRVKIFLNNINKYDKALLITHRGFIKSLYHILNKTNDNINIEYGSIYIIENGSIKQIY